MVIKTTTLRRWGNSVAIKLTKEILNEAILSENEHVKLTADKTGIWIQKIEIIQTLDDLFRDYDGIYEFHENN